MKMYNALEYLMSISTFTMRLVKQEKREILFLDIYTADGHTSYSIEVPNSEDYKFVFDANNSKIKYIFYMDNDINSDVACSITFNDKSDLRFLKTNAAISVAAYDYTQKASMTRFFD